MWQAECVVVFHVSDLSVVNFAVCRSVEPVPRGSRTTVLLMFAPGQRTFFIGNGKMRVFLLIFGALSLFPWTGSLVAEDRGRGASFRGQLASLFSA